jgi:hypothetical protein
MLPEAKVAHAQPGRVRIRFLDKTNDEAFFLTLGRTLRQWPESVRVVTNALTGSVLLAYRGDLPTLLDYAEERGLFRVLAGDHSRGVVDVEAHPRIPSSRDHIEQAEEQSREVDALVGVTLLGLAVFQARRGKFLPAGLTLVFNAIDFLRPVGHRRRR